MTAQDNVLHFEEIDTSLSLLTARFSNPVYKGAKLNIWLFDSQERRQKAEQTFAAHGINAKIRSAYKPLIHALLEDLDLEEAEEIVIHYPVVEKIPEIRFLLEAYPACDLIGQRTCRFEAMAVQPATEPLFYKIILRSATKTDRVHRVFAPNHLCRDHTDKMILTNCGWLRIKHASSPDLECDEPFSSDLETAFAAVMGFLARQEWSSQNQEEPFFDRLEMEISAPFYERALPLAGEWISTAEAMHEDLYFSALEQFKVRQRIPPSDRRFAPGQLVPVLKTTKDEKLGVKIKITQDPHLLADCQMTKNPPQPDRREGWQCAGNEQQGALTTLDRADHWLSPRIVKTCLDELGGQNLDTRSRRGRPILGRYFPGSGPGLMLSAGQHANETSGTIGALRAASELSRKPDHHFALVPQINPDGFALFRELCHAFPNHMNHAARYTAGGCDLEYINRGFENEVCHQAKALMDASLHLNLHGYPSHEWTRPFSGYIPRGLELWTLPKGFVLILRYKKGWKEKGDFILNRIVDALSAMPDLVAFNAKQLKRYTTFTSGETAFEIRNGFPCLVQEVTDSLFPMTIITEAPDETVYDKDFILQHTAQTRSILAAYEALIEIR